MQNIYLQNIFRGKTRLQFRYVKRNDLQMESINPKIVHSCIKIRANKWMHLDNLLAEFIYFENFPNDFKQIQTSFCLESKIDIISAITSCFICKETKKLFFVLELNNRYMIYFRYRLILHQA